MTAKHSEGPWTAHDDGWQPWEGAIEIRGQDGTICWTTSGGNERANASLIAAAPELLNTLKAALAVHGDGYSWGKAARAAIARLSGERDEERGSVVTEEMVRAGAEGVVAEWGKMIAEMAPHSTPGDIARGFVSPGNYRLVRAVLTAAARARSE